MVVNVVKQVRLTLGLGLIATACVSPASPPARITTPKSADAQSVAKGARPAGPSVRIALPTPSSLPTVNDGARAAPTEMVTALRSLWSSFPGKTGIAVMKTDGSWMVSYRGDEPMPQQSVSKLWVAIAVMDAVDKGKLSLDDSVTLRKSDMTLFHQPIAGLIGPNGYTTTISSLLKRAMTQSDNTANDFLMRRVGGPNAIRELIASKRLGAIRFGPGERNFQAATAGLVWKPEYSSAGAFNAARAALSPATRKAAMDKYVSDPMDPLSDQFDGNVSDRPSPPKGRRSRRLEACAQNRYWSGPAEPHSGLQRCGHHGCARWHQLCGRCPDRRYDGPCSGASEANPASRLCCRCQP